jgi:release factor glutamine methyltransferase
MKGLKNNTVYAVFEWFYGQLAVKYDSNEAKSVASIIFEQFLHVTSLDLLVHKDRRISESEITNLYRIIKKLLDDVPVQYITGKGYFRHLELFVDSNVLIPRPETEELVQWVLDDHKTLQKNSLKIWDVGTGSGAIALSLASELPLADVWASDVSREALTVASKNAGLNSCKVNFFHHNILIDNLPVQDFDVLVSNPPYIKESEKSLMKNNVLKYEPHLALFVTDHDALIFYRALGKAALQALKPAGELYVEINEALGTETCDLFLSLGFKNIEVRKDIYGKDRFVKAWGFEPQ